MIEHCNVETWEERRRERQVERFTIWKREKLEEERNTYNQTMKIRENGSVIRL